ncbi:MAG: NlpC/P60 family protein [Atopobiaceae bacterium]|nr:NlpC/P60 family protein [Atopobiaceae bacterium]
MACALGLALSLQAPSIAFATPKEDLQQQLEQARQTIATLSSEAELAEYDLLTVTQKLDGTKQSIDALSGQIPGTQGHLVTARAELSAIISDSYKYGTPTLLDMLMNTVSFDEFITRVEYAQRIEDYKLGVLDEVKGLSNELQLQMNELENERANQEALVTQHEQRMEAAEKAASSAEEYFNSLSSELQEMIAAERAAEQAAAQEAARRAAAAQAANAASNTSPQDPGSQSISVTDSDSQQSDEPIQQQSPDPFEGDEVGGGQVFHFDTSYGQLDEGIIEVGVSDSVSEFVSRAFSIVGGGYRYSGYNWTGNTFTSEFTCSGVIDFARGLPSRSSSPESLYNEVGSRMVYNTSQLNFGDLVFYAYGGRVPTGHVGIYIGGGQIIDSIPNGGVSIRDVNYMSFVGGGPIF